MFSCCTQISTTMEMENNAFVSYLPCLVERGIDPAKAGRLATRGFVIDPATLGWEAHRDYTAMEDDFTKLTSLFGAAPHPFNFHRRLPTTVEETVNNIEYLKQNISMSNRISTNSIALLGHGRCSDGALGVLARPELQIISPDDVFKWIVQLGGSTPTHHLHLLVDSCYSGKWVAYFEKKFADNIELPVVVTVQSSSSDSQDAFGGAFTPIWLCTYSALKNSN
jgi:hypothetical protein